MNLLKSIKTISSAGLVLVVAACSVTPEPVTVAERKATAEEDLRAMFVSQEPLEGPLNLYAAQARGLVYNLDHRIRRMEEAIAFGRARISSYDMLPEVVAQAGYTDRNNQLAAFSRSVLTGNQTLEPSTSSDRSRWSGDAGLSWNLLDFGLSYYQARQNADRALIAEERRRKVVQNLLLDIRYAYWRAAAAQKLTGKVNASLKDAEKALADSRKSMEEQVQPVLTALKYQQSLLDIIRQLEALKNELTLARTELTTLLNLPPNTKLELVIPDELEVHNGMQGVAIDQLEDISLVNRPELYEADYNTRIARNEARKELLKMLPGVRLTAGGYFDNNSFAYHDTWREFGSFFSWNLVDFFTGPARRRQADRVTEVSKVQRVALSVAILSQVRIAHQQYQSSVDSYSRAREIRDINEKIAAHITASTNSNQTDKLTQVRTSATAIFSELREYQSYAMYQNALGRVYSSIGMNPIPISFSEDDLPQLEAALKARYADWNSGNLPEINLDRVK